MPYCLFRLFLSFFFFSLHPCNVSYPSNGRAVDWFAADFLCFYCGLAGIPRMWLQTLLTVTVFLVTKFAHPILIFYPSSSFDHYTPNGVSDNPRHSRSFQALHMQTRKLKRLETAITGVLGMSAIWRFSKSQRHHLGKSNSGRCFDRTASLRITPCSSEYLIAGAETPIQTPRLYPLSLSAVGKSDCSSLETRTKPRLVSR